MEIEQFENLLNKVKVAYEESDIKDRNLYYSLVGTQIKPNQPLIVGLNWGGGSDEDLKKMKEKGHTYEPQTINDYQELINNNTNFFSEGLDMGKLSLITENLEMYPSTKDKHIGWTNFCFFRTPDEPTLTNKDIELTKHIFIELINAIQPSMIICLSRKLRDFIDNNKKINFTTLDRYKVYEEESNKYNGLIGTLNDIPFYALPHPCSHMGHEARNYAWEYCFKIIMTKDIMSPVKRPKHKKLFILKCWETPL